MMGTFYVNGGGTMFDFAGGLSAMVGLMAPVIPGIQLTVTGAFGLGPLQADLQAQLNASLNVSISWDPLLAIKGMMDVIAALQGGLLPQVGLSAACSASLVPKIGGIGLAIDAALALTIPVTSVLAGINGVLGISGPTIRYCCWEGDVGTLAAEIGGALSLGAGTHRYVIAMSAADPQFFTNMNFMFNVS